MEQKKINLSLVIPTYNDEKTIIKQVKVCEEIVKKLTASYEIIIADDKSTDNTPKLLKKYFSRKKNFKIITNKSNLGITKNVRQLYMSAKKDFVLFYSADGDWNPKDVGNLIKTQAKNNSDIVIGKRKKKIGYTSYRKLISTMHRLLPLVFFGVDTIDPGGIKLIRKKYVQVPLVSNSQLFEAEIIIRAKKKGARIDSYPVVYEKPYSGAGYGGAFKSATESFIDLLKLRLRL
jgi:glycosyltransferase AglD